MNLRLNEECIDEHNRLRAIHGCEPLKLDKRLATAAQNYATDLAMATILNPSSAEDYGENLAVRTSNTIAKLTGKQATLMWYSEIEHYDFDRENQLNCGHFSQVVWKNTKRAGFGCASSYDGHQIFLVGRYLPPGNYKDEWIENVPRPLNGELMIPTKEEIYGPELLPVTQSSEQNNKQEGDLIDSTISNQYSYRNDNQQSKSPTSQEHCIWQYSQFIEIHSEDSQKIDMFVRVRERFHSNVTENEFETETYYKAFTGEKVSMMLPLGILHYKEDNESQLEVFRCEVFHTHNHYRKIHSAPELMRCEELDTLAQQWADTCRDHGEPSYSEWLYNGSVLGENVSYRLLRNSHISARRLIGKWYEESENYSYSVEPEDGKFIGHFTQLIWKSSKIIGIGFARSSDLNWGYIVCFYYPPGNEIGQFRANVCPPNSP